ncbi:sialidase family protein [Paenibacillus koleovorans]|uniref:sialidase family protein n=1 Tax=Paenibacillus koleovorans TaxID=121608 RepID=UPI000FD9D29F|nr:sialidase family protein [Paenibacillus koleovorans]
MPNTANFHGMKHLQESNKVDIRKEPGIYLHVAGMAKTKRGIVCTYRLADQHMLRSSDIMVCYSYDGGRTWEGHRSISHLDVEHDQAVWIAPELNALPDGRLVIIVDKGNRKPDEEHVSLVYVAKAEP